MGAAKRRIFTKPAIEGLSSRRPIMVSANAGTTANATANNIVKEAIT